MWLLSLLLLFSITDTTDNHCREVLQAVASYIEPLGFEMDSTAVRIEWVDINGDSRLDPVVYLTGIDWCGSGGCTLLVFETMDGIDAQEWGAYRPAAEISMVAGSVRVAPSGDIWSDLIVAGADAAPRVLRFDGETYPQSPGGGDALDGPLPGGVTLFSDAR